MMVSSCQQAVLVGDEAIEVAIIFILDDGDFQFGGEIWHKLIDEKPVLDIVIFEVDFDILKMIGAT